VLWLLALGCPDVEKPRHGWLVRERAGIAMLGCNESSKVWRLTCDDNRWIGPTVNCSPPGALSPPPTQASLTHFCPQYQNDDNDEGIPCEAG